MENNFGQNTIPENDNQRVAALQRYQILDTPPERSFDNIAKLAAQLFELPIAMINFVDTENVFVKASNGLDHIRTAPRNNSLCSLAMLSDEVTVFETLPDADPCLLTNLMSAAELGFKFYAGAPLITGDGFRIGTICVIGMRERAFTEKERKLLKSMAKIVMDEIELRVKGMYLQLVSVNNDIKATREDLSQARKCLKDTLFELPAGQSGLKFSIAKIDDGLRKVEEALSFAIKRLGTNT